MIWFPEMPNKSFDEDQYEFITVVEVSEFPNGERLFVEVNDEVIVVFNIAGEIFAIGDYCSHDSGPLGEGDLVDYEIFCPRHGAGFDIRDGKVLSLPAVEDIPTYPTRIVDGRIEIGLPLDID